MAQSNFSRRGFLGRTAGTLAYMGTPSIISAGNQAGGLPNLPHHKATAKRVIYLFQSGGPSHIDLFDYKPTLEKLHGTNLPDSVRGNQRVTGMTAGQKQFLVNKTVSPIKPRGQSGVTISDLLPYTSGIADDICLVKSVHTEAINHDPGITFINTGSQIPGLPSLGAWCNYGLGSNNRDMPGYIVMLSQGKGKNPGQPIFSRLWGSGFIPSSHQGVQLRGGGTPILYLDDPKGIDRKSRRKMLDDIAKLNAMRLDQSGDPEIATRNFQYDMAYRMQASAPEITDLTDEPESTFKLYGEDARIPGTYAYNCLLARRMAERDVRFIQLFHRGWDQHNSLVPHLTAQCKDTDQASAALVTDLKQRGMLDDTLVIWGGEFGRSVYSQGKINAGRDHHGRCFSMWMAGGGIASGRMHGETDDFCYNITKDPVHIRDLTATALHCLGINDKRFTFKHQGLNHTPTGVEPTKVVKQILA
ncbi:MAG: DUF1501 domain-containing protein [Akkermansiaceae bacterium]|nr:DUF1501 domain-containing protein [Akkermansiaceae bacterium]